MIVTFFGHKDTPGSIKPKLETALISLIENNGADLFYVGNEGSFDRMARDVLKKLKLSFPHINYYVVLAYMPKNNDYEDYSDSIYPNGLENVPKRYAISERNKWLVNKCDTVVTYVLYTGGASKFKELAIKKGKNIIELSIKNRLSN